MRRLLVTALAAGLGLACGGCGLDSLFVNLATRDQSTRIPKAADNILVADLAPGVENPKVVLLQGYSSKVEGVGVDRTDGRLKLRFRGNTEFRMLRMVVQWERGQALALVPLIPRQASVLDPERTIPLSQTPGMDPVGALSTTLTLLFVGKAMDQGISYDSVSPKDAGTALAQLLQKVSDTDEGRSFMGLVTDLIAEKGHPFRVLMPDQPAIGDLLSEDVPDDERKAFVQSLLAAADGVNLPLCLDPHRMRVVFQVEFRDGLEDSNCQVVDRFKWAQDKPGKTMYFTGGVHKKTPVCGKADPPCVDQDVVDQANAELGNWKPNVIQMYDDGTHGDAAAGDGIYTLVLDLPYIPITESPHGRGFRIGYKYTWGLPGQGWTGSEEWPGNQRILEVVDVNGDGVVVRRDIFGDETSNKDKANLLTPQNGGCGVNFFEDEKRDGCAHDTWENMIDTDGDCMPDTWPAKGPVTPIVGECE